MAFDVAMCHDSPMTATRTPAPLPAIGSSIWAQIGTRRPVEYVVLEHLADDLVLGARPSRKYPGNYIGAARGIPVEYIED